MNYEVDLNEYESDGSQQYLIPHGEYLMEIKDVVPGESKKGLPQLKFRFDLVNLPKDWEYNSRVYTTITLIPKGERGHGIAVHFLKNLGFKPDEDGVMSFELEEFMGLKVLATVYQEKGTDGNTYNRVKDFKFWTPEEASSQAEESAADTNDVPF